MSLNHISIFRDSYGTAYRFVLINQQIISNDSLGSPIQANPLRCEPG